MYYSFTEFTPSYLIHRNNSGKRPLSGQRQTNSANVLAMIGELTCSLTKQIASKSSELQRLNDLVESMQVLQFTYLNCHRFFFDRFLNNNQVTLSC